MMTSSPPQVNLSLKTISHGKHIYVNTTSPISSSSSNHIRTIADDHSKAADNIVVAWLDFLQLSCYSQSFLENGYDDLETVKQIGPEDLDAINVVSPHHRAFLLDAVKVMREQGGAWVYLLLGAHEYSTASRGDIVTGRLEHQSVSSGIASANSSNGGVIPLEEDHHAKTVHRISPSISSSTSNSPVSTSRTSKRTTEHCLGVGGGGSCMTETTDCPSEISAITSISNLGGRRNLSPLDGAKACTEHSVDVLNQIQPPLAEKMLKLRRLIRRRLSQDAIRLSAPHYAVPTACNAHLASLASKYSNLLGYRYVDVLQQLEDIRLAEWSDIAPPPPTAPSNRGRYEMSTSDIYWQQNKPQLPNNYVNCYRGNDFGDIWDDRIQSIEEPTYVPGAYQPSSCLSEKEGCQIYDYAAKYRNQIRYHQAKMYFTPQGWIQMAKRLLTKNGSNTSLSSSSSSKGSQNRCKCYEVPPQPVCRCGGSSRYANAQAKSETDLISLQSTRISKTNFKKTNTLQHNAEVISRRRLGTFDPRVCHETISSYHPHQWCEVGGDGRVNMYQTKVSYHSQSAAAATAFNYPAFFDDIARI